MSRRHKHRNKNKVKQVVAYGHDKANKTVYEVSKDEDFFKSININCAHMLMSLMDDDEDDLSMSYDEIAELLEAASELKPHPIETKNKDKRP